MPSRFLCLAMTAALLMGRMAVAEPADDAPAWSESVNGLQARLSFARKAPVAGTPIIATYLELRNVSDGAGAIELPVDGGDVSMEWQVVNSDGKTVPPTLGPFDEIRADVGVVRIPFDSTLRLNVAHWGAGIRGGYAAHLDLGATANWDFKRGDKQAYYLRGKVIVKKRGADGWSGTLVLPKAKLPTVDK